MPFDQFSAQSDNYNVALKAAAMANQAQCAAPPTGLEVLKNRLGSSLDDAARIVERLSQLEGRLTGGCPPSAKDATARPQPTGHLPMLSAGFDELQNRHASASEIISRLFDAI